MGQLKMLLQIEFVIINNLHQPNSAPISCSSPTIANFTLPSFSLDSAGQDPDFNERAIDLAQRFDNVYAMVGLNPDIAKNYDQKAEDKLIEQIYLTIQPNH